MNINIRRLRAKFETCVKLAGFALQVEDDMIPTLNHVLVYQEESERLNNRR